jgi:hypothetical protein
VVALIGADKFAAVGLFGVLPVVKTVSKGGDDSLSLADMVLD